MSLPIALHLIAPVPHGGAESMVGALAGAWHRAGGNGGVVVLMVHPESPHYVSRLREQGVRVWEVHSSVRGYATEVREVSRILRESGAQLLHSHAYRADAVAHFATRRTPVAFVSTAHGFTGGGLKNQCYEAFDRWLMRRAAAVSCVSEALHTRLRASGVASERLQLIPNTTAAFEPLSRAAARAELGLPAAGAFVGWIGRLSREKDPEAFLNAVLLTPAGISGAVIGDGPLRDALQMHRAVTSGRVRLLGPRADARRLLPAFDVLALSSQTEGTPMVLLESMFARVPIVAFGVGGVPALLGDAAVVLAPGEVAAMATSIGNLLAEPAKAVALAESAHRRLNEQFGEAAWVRAYAGLYARALR